MDEKFDDLVAEAVDHIPEQYREKMKSIAILTADYPSEDQLGKTGVRKHHALFGLYEGVPLPLRGGRELLALPPDRITIFKHPMIDIFTDEQDLKNQIYETLWHEVAHYFGLNHSQINEKHHNK